MSLLELQRIQRLAASGVRVAVAAGRTLFPVAVASVGILGAGLAAGKSLEYVGGGLESVGIIKPSSTQEQIRYLQERNKLIEAQKTAQLQGMSPLTPDISTFYTLRDAPNTRSGSTFDVVPALFLGAAVLGGYLLLKGRK